MLLEAETNKYCPGGNDIGAISNLITWVLNIFLSVSNVTSVPFRPTTVQVSNSAPFEWKTNNSVYASDY
jgi:hypothetical protein